MDLLSLRESGVSSTRPASSARLLPGFVFFNGVSGSDPMQLLYRYDEGALISTDWVAASGYERATSAPFATHEMNFIVLTSNNISVCNGSILYGDLSALFVLQLGGSAIKCLHAYSNSAFAAAFRVGNFMSEDTFPILSFNDIPVFEFNLSAGILSASIWGNTSAHDRYPLDVSGLKVSICSDQMDCRYTLIPNPTVIHSQQSVWVIFTDDSITTFEVYTPTSIVGPSFLNSYYNISSNIGHQKASQLIYASVNQTFSPSDLALYQMEYGIPSHVVSYDVNGHSNSSFCEVDAMDCGEANLDVQILTSISQSPSPTTYFYDLDFEDYFLSWIMTMADSPSPSLVQSVSYGEDELAVPVSYYQAFNTEALKVMI